MGIAYNPRDARSSKQDFANKNYEFLVSYCSIKSFIGLIFEYLKYLMMQWHCIQHEIGSFYKHYFYKQIKYTARNLHLVLVLSKHRMY